MEKPTDTGEIVPVTGLKIASWAALGVGVIIEVIGIIKHDQATMQGGLFSLGVGVFGKITANIAAGSNDALLQPHNTEDSGQQR